MSERGIIVCERTGDWALALRQALARGAPVTLRETRSPAETVARLDEFVAAVVVVECHAGNARAVLELLADIGWRGSRFAAVAVLASPTVCDPLELRACGVVGVATSFTEVGEIATIARRHLARQPANTSDSELDWHSAIWARLPWSAERSSSPIAD